MRPNPKELAMLVHAELRITRSYLEISTSSDLLVVKQTLTKYDQKLNKNHEPNSQLR